MKTNFLLAIVLLCVISCASSSTKRHFGEVVDDAVISNRLKFKFLKDKMVSGFDINIDTFKGIVSLRGQVTDQSQIDRAIELAERENGVRSVKSYLYKDPEKQKAFSSRSESVKESKVRSKSGKSTVTERSITQ